MRRSLVLLALLASCRFDMPPYCGNDVIDVDEMCDDGNAFGGDGCSADCKSDETCGNRILDRGEECEDGNNSNSDGCDSNCTFTGCGNGIPTEGEECDFGTSNADYGRCLVNCHFARCGDGVVWIDGEDCDDGNAVTETCAPGQSSCTVCNASCHYGLGIPG